MKRTKEWWARLTEDERRRLVYLECFGGRYSFLPDDCCECPSCSTPHISTGLCPLCQRELDALLAKADGKVVAR